MYGESAQDLGRAGGRGQNVRIIDIEGAWRFTHEDLRQMQGGVVGGTQSTSIGWRNHGTGHHAVLGLLLGALVLTRTIGIAMIGAVIVHALASRHKDTHRLRGGDWIVVGTALLLFGAWSGVSPDGDTNYLTYMGPVILSTFGVDNGYVDLLAVSKKVLALFPAAFKEYLFWFTGARHLVVAGWMLVGYVMLTAAGGLLIRIRRRCLDAYYVSAYLLILLIWPYPAELYRFLFPVVPFMIFHAVFFLREVLRPRVARPVFVAILLPGLIAVTVSAMARIGVAQRASVVEAPYRHSSELYRSEKPANGVFLARLMKDSMNDMVKIGLTTPENAVVLGVKPNFVALLSGRRTARFVPQADSGAHYCQLIRQAVDYAYLSQVTTSRNEEGLRTVQRFMPFSSVTWMRTDDSGKLKAILLEIDRNRLVQEAASLSLGCVDRRPQETH